MATLNQHSMSRPGFCLGGARIYRDDSAPGGLRTDHDEPSYDDSSKCCGEILPSEQGLQLNSESLRSKPKRLSTGYLLFSRQRSRPDNS